jgi:hypothetical protein
VGEYNVKGSLTIAGTLTIPACTVVKLAPGANITVKSGGALKLMGTEAGKVKITSSNSAPAAGDWGYIEFSDGSSTGECEMHHATIEYGGKGYGMVYVAGGASVAMDHLIMQHAEKSALEVKARGRLRNFTDNVITKSGVPIEIDANSVGDILGGTFTGNTADVISVLGSTIDRTATWKAHGVPYRSSSLSVRGAATPQVLTIAEGVTLQLRPQATVVVGRDGALQLRGTAAAPVKVTSSEASPSPGDWSYIEFQDGSTAGANVIENAVVEYGGKDYGAIYLSGGAGLKMTNSVLQKSGHIGLQIVGDDSKLRDFTGNTIQECALGPIAARANVVGQIGAGTYTGNTIDTIRVTGGTISTNATWGDWGVPYTIDSSFTVNASTGTATLTLAAGTKLAMGNATGFTVRKNGALIANGTSAKRVAITSVAAAPTMGIWNYIQVDSLGNAMNYTDVSYGGGGGTNTGYGQLYVSAESGISLNNTVFANGKLCDVDRGSKTSSTVNATASTYAPCPE